MDPESNTISFEELLHDLETIQVKTENPMLYEILKRVLDFEEL